MKFNLSKNNNQLEPPPDEINTQSGLCMWRIHSNKDDCEYKIWAMTYEEALRMLPMIENI